MPFRLGLSLKITDIRRKIVAAGGGGGISLTNTFVVAPSGGDGTSIDDAVGTAGVKYIWVRSGTYVETITGDVADQRIYFEPGTTITGATTISAANVSWEFGAGCSVSGVITWTGANGSLVARNGCDFSEGLDASTTADDLYVDGGGWGTIFATTGTNDAIEIGGDYTFISNTAIDSPASGGGGNRDSISVSGGIGLGTVFSVKVIQSDVVGVQLDDPDMLFLGSTIIDSDSTGVWLAEARQLVVGNYTLSAGSDGINVNASSDNSVIAGNIVNNQVASSVDLEAGGDNCIVASNRLEGGVNDSSTGSTVGANDVSTI